jgi:hypothetical protein
VNEEDVRKANLALFGVISRKFATESEENHKNFSQASQFTGQYLNSGLVEYKARVLTIRHRSAVFASLYTVPTLPNSIL